MVKASKSKGKNGIDENIENIWKTCPDVPM